MRTTHTLVQVAMALLQGGPQHWGYEVSKLAGVTSGATYPILSRMVDSGWLIKGQEESPKPALEGRPPRRYFELTDIGRDELKSLLISALDDTRFMSFQDQLQAIVSGVEVQA